MLRSTISPRACSSYGRAYRAQWLAVPSNPASQAKLRRYANDVKPSIKDSKTAVMPGSASSATNQPFPGGSTSPPTPTSSSSALPEKLPQTPLPPSSSTQKSPTNSIPSASKTPPVSSSPLKASIPPPPPPPSPPAPRRIRFRTYLLALVLLSGIGFAGGVYFSLVNDDFHDFFTEYVPFGEEAVLYFEEQEFRRRYPAAAERALGPPRDTGRQVTIPSGSGVSWNVHDGESQSKTSTKDKIGQLTSKAKTVIQEKVEDVEKLSLTESAQARAQELKEKVAEAPSKVKQEAKKVVNSASKDITSAKDKALPRTPAESKPQDAKKPVEKKPDGKFPILSRIDPLTIADANDPIVQDLVKIMNDIITVANADNSSGKFTSSINQAKSALSSVGSRIVAMKKEVTKAADEKIRSSHEEFDEAAKELIRRFEAEVQDQETRWKTEFEEEKQKISDSYQSRLTTELQRSKEASEKKLHNELLEQALAMKKDFTSTVKARVEEERDGRLGKLSELSSSVSELEKMTSHWSDVVDVNLQTQRLHVAVETVRSSLEKADKPRPFVRELAALKEIASNDAVVNAAIASINPTAYQKGIPTSAQLIDRFRRVASEVRKASLLPENAGVASHAASYIFSRFLFKKNGLADGNDVESVLTRTETLLEEGDLDGAAREMNELNGWARALSKDWLGEVRKVLEVQQALDVSRDHKDRNQANKSNRS